MLNINKLLDVIAWIILFISIVFLGVFSRELENIVNGNKFVLKFSLIGLLVSSFILFSIFKLNRSYFQEGSNKRGSAVLSYFFGIIIIVLFFAGFLNNQTAKQNLREIDAVVVEKTENVRYKTGYIKLSVNEKIERFDVRKNDWNKIKTNDTIKITIGTGKLGYDYILEFRPIKTDE